jgi:hypothetical protein
MPDNSHKITRLQEIIQRMEEDLESQGLPEDILTSDLV